MFNFKTATREKCKASIMIEGLTGLGKTGLSLAIGKGLSSSWDKVAHVDTENRSAQLYVGLKNPAGEKYQGFQVGEFTPELGYKPSNYLAFIEAAIKGGMEVCIEDSISHAWQYKGGILDMVNDLKATNNRYQKDSYAAWGDSQIVKEKNELLQMIRNPKIHIITTVRLKEKLEYDRDENGKTKLVSLGEQQIQQADLKYEADLVLRMVQAGTDKTYPVAEVMKTRYAIFTKGEVYEFTPALIEQLRVYLEEGVDPEELLEEQRQDYIKLLKGVLESKPTTKMVFNVMRSDKGYEGKKLDEMPLDVLKSIYIALTID